MQIVVLLIIMLCYLNVNRPKTVHKSVKFRAFRKISCRLTKIMWKWFWIIKAKLQKILMIWLTIIIQYYRIWLTNMLHYNVRKSHCDPHSPWYTSALIREMRVRMRGEWVAARTQVEVDRQIVQNMYRRRNGQFVEAKSTYFTNKVEESKGNPKALFRLTMNMMGNSGYKRFPVHTCKINMANDFSAFFYNKILNIRSELGLIDPHTGGSVTNCFFWSPTKYLYECYWTRDMEYN